MGIIIDPYESPVQARRKLVEKLANDLRVQHNVNAVMVVFFEEQDTPFSISIAPNINAKPLVKALPERLREIAEKSVGFAREILNRIGQYSV